MKNGKYSARRSGSKVLVLALAMVLLVTATVGGTLAWLTDKTDEVKNVFTTADIGVTLVETFNTDTNNDQKPDTWRAQLVPGYSYVKDPVVTVKADSVDCWLFVKFEETNTPSTYLTYTSTLTTTNDWTQGDGTNIPSNVWYREVTSSDKDQSWYLLDGVHEDGCNKGDDCTCKFADGKVTVKDSLTKSSMPADNATPQLTYTAYAFQLYKDAGEKFTAVEAWGKINPPTT